MPNSLPDTTLPRRSEVPVVQTWDLASVYPSDDAYEDAAREALDAVPTLTRWQGQLASSPDTLHSAFKKHVQ